MWKQSASSISVVARRLINGYNMKRTDRVGDSLLVYDDHDFWMESDEILVRHAQLLSIRQFQGERMKAILQTASDLINNHGLKVFFH